MALISCVECGRKISEYALCCPNCGCPMDHIKSITSELSVKGSSYNRYDDKIKKFSDYYPKSESINDDKECDYLAIAKDLVFKTLAIASSHDKSVVDDEVAIKDVVDDNTIIVKDSRVFSEIKILDDIDIEIYFEGVEFNQEGDIDKFALLFGGINNTGEKFVIKICELRVADEPIMPSFTLGTLSEYEEDKFCYSYKSPYQTTVNDMSFIIAVYDTDNNMKLKSWYITLDVSIKEQFYNVKVSEKQIDNSEEYEFEAITIIDKDRDFLVYFDGIYVDAISFDLEFTCRSYGDDARYVYIEDVKINDNLYCAEKQIAEFCEEDCTGAYFYIEEENGVSFLLISKIEFYIRIENQKRDIIDKSRKVELLVDTALKRVALKTMQNCS